MKNVPAQFTTEKDKTANSPIYLVEITGKGYSTNPAYYIASAPDVTTYTGPVPTHVYDDGHLVKGGGIGCIRYQGRLCAGFAATSNCTIHLRNEGDFSDFLNTYAEPINLEVRVRLIFNDGTPLLDSEAVDLFRGVIAGWKHDQQTVTLECVDRGFGGLPELPIRQVSKKQWPNAPVESIGACMPIVYGDWIDADAWDHPRMVHNGHPVTCVHDGNNRFVVADHPVHTVGNDLWLYNQRANALTYVPGANLIWPSTPSSKHVIMALMKGTVFVQLRQKNALTTTGIEHSGVCDESSTTGVTLYGGDHADVRDGPDGDEIWLEAKGLSGSLGAVPPDPDGFSVAVYVSEAAGGGTAALRYIDPDDGPTTSAADTEITNASAGVITFNFGDAIQPNDPPDGGPHGGAEWRWPDIVNTAFGVQMPDSDAGANDLSVTITNAYLFLEDVSLGKHWAQYAFKTKPWITGVRKWGFTKRHGPETPITQTCMVMARIIGFPSTGNLSTGGAGSGTAVETPADLLESIALDWWGVDPAKVNTSASGSGYHSFPQLRNDMTGTRKTALCLHEKRAAIELADMISRSTGFNVWWGSEGKLNASYFDSSATSRHTFTAANMQANPQVSLSPVSEVATGVRIKYKYDFGRQEYNKEAFVDVEKRFSGSLLNGALDSSETGITVDDADDFFLESGSDAASDATGKIITSATAQFKSTGIRAGDLFVFDLAANDQSAIASGDSETQITLDDAVTDSLAGQTYYVVQQYILVDREIMQITDVEPEVLTVTRGACGSTADTHADNTPVFLLIPDSDDGTGTRDESGDGNREYKAMLSVAKYGQTHTQVVEAECVRHDGTAALTRDHYFDYSYEQKPTIRFSTGLEAAHLEIHDLVTITHDRLPDAASGGKFEILELTHRPPTSDPVSNIEIFARGV